jgi:hypothetical protein
MSAEQNFEVAGTLQGGEAPPVWPMVRQPR